MSKTRRTKWDCFLDQAERVHLGLLRFLTGALTVLLILVPVSFYLLARGVCRYPIRQLFPTFFGEPGNVAALLFFLVSYGCMFTVLFWLCLICKRLKILRRLVVWSCIWIPGLNYLLAWQVRQLARQEIDHTLYKIRLDDVRVEQQICRTRYPLLLVHGIGFRDFKYFNYWGRIPRELVRNGAKVYYGHQEAWGTIEDNAAILKEKILEICRENHCDKVNIIAHSKGGLDSRYLISGLSMAPYVASLTTINTPHRGSALVDFLKRMPDGMYRMISRRIDRYFMLMGDRAPRTYEASWQLSCVYAREFNQRYPDADGVYYQSYMSLMKHCFSSRILCIPYLVLRILDGPNDGLVTAESARWTNFHEILKNRRRRGISHADMIDLSRDDYPGFDVLEFYVEVAKELAEKGF